MNRTDRLYAMVEELRAVAPRPRSARWLAGRFEVSPRTIERDIGALQESGVPIYAEPGRTGGYALDRAHTLPPVNVSPSEAVAIAVALRRLDGAPFADAARSALHKLLAVMPPQDVARAGELARRVHLLHPPEVPAGAADARAAKRRRAGSSRWATSVARATGTCWVGAGCATVCARSGWTGSRPCATPARWRRRAESTPRISTSRPSG